jgi:fructokinase
VAATSVDDDGRASYTFDLAWHRLPATPPALISPAVGCVHLGSLATVLRPGADDVLALARAARGTAMISFDPNCRPTLTPDAGAIRARVAELVATSDIVKASIDDRDWLYPGRDPRDVAGEWLERGAARVAVTLGGDGAWAATPHRSAGVEPCPVTVADTIGAGDAFTAGLLCALDEAGLLGAARRAELRAIDAATLAEVLAFAARVAALTCARRGADPPTLDRLPVTR